MNIINFPFKNKAYTVPQELICELINLDSIEDYNSFSKAIRRSSEETIYFSKRAQKLIAALLKERIDHSGDFSHFYQKYLAYSTIENRRLIFSSLKETKDLNILSDIYAEIEEIFQSNPSHFYRPYDTNWVKHCIREYSLLSNQEAPNIFLIKTYEEIILEELFRGALNGLSNKIENLFNDELRRMQA